MTGIKGRIIDYDEYAALTLEDRAKTAIISCGPDCTCDTPKTGLAICRLDRVENIYPDATHALHNRETDEWIVYEFDEHAPQFMREAGRHDAKDVDAIRYMPNESRMYSHLFKLDEDS